MWSLKSPKKDRTPQWQFYHDYNNTTKLEKHQLNIIFGLKTAQNNFKVTSWDDPTSHSTLVRTWDMSYTFPLYRDWNKWNSYQSQDLTMNPNFFSGSPKGVITPDSRKNENTTPTFPRGGMCGFWFFILLWMNICNCLGDLLEVVIISSRQEKS